MDQLSCINAFIQIIEQGSLRKAAEKIHQTDAAISKKLTKLESSLGVILLERGHGKIKLTDLGQQYYTICKEATEKITFARELVQHATIIPKGELKVSCISHHAYKCIMPKLKGFLKQYPEIRLTLSISDHIPDIAHGEMDILFGISMPIPDQDNNLVRKKIGITRDILCATPAYLNLMGHPQKINDLMQLNFIGHTSRKPIDIINFDNNIKLQVNPFLIFDDNIHRINAALQDLGYIYTKKHFVNDYLESGQLVEILAKYNQKNQLPICAYYRYQLYPDPKISAFMKFFV